MSYWTVASKAAASLAGIAVLCLAVPAAAETVVLQQGLNGYNGFEDASMNKGDNGSAAAANTNYGSNQELDVAIKGQCPLCHTSQALIKFDLSSIPANATIQKAKLELYYVRRGEGTNPTNLIIYRARQAWNEGWVTWNNSYSNMVPGVLAKRYCVGLETPAIWEPLLITDAVQDMVDGTYPNYGFMLAREGLINYKNGEQYYASSEYRNAAMRPKVTIQYTVPSGVHDSMQPAVSAAVPGPDAVMFDIRGRRITAGGSGICIVVNGNGAAPVKTMMVK